MTIVIATSIAASLAVAVEATDFPGMSSYVVWIERIGGFAIVVIFFWLALHMARRWHGGVAIAVDDMSVLVS